MRKPVKRAILPQNINIKNNQPYLCALWSEMSLGIKAVFTDYAKAYKIDTRQKRTQGVSSFSMFIYFLYRLQGRYQVKIKDMTVSFVMDIFSQFNTIKKLMKNSLLYSLNRRFYLQNSKLIDRVKAPKLVQQAGIEKFGEEFYGENSEEGFVQVLLRARDFALRRVGIITSFKYPNSTFYT